MFFGHSRLYFFAETPTVIYISLKSLATIFRTENVWQLINLAISGVKIAQEEVQRYELANVAGSVLYMLKVS